MAYIGAVASHPGYVGRFAADLVQPGLRIPITADTELFAEAAVLGREVIWLHTFGERLAAPAEGRPSGAPWMPRDQRPKVPAGGAIPSSADAMPDVISYDPAMQRLQVGTGYVDGVPPQVWAYQVSGKQVLTQWFSYRGRDRSRPMIGDRRPPSPLVEIQSEGWPADYTTELLKVLNVLGRLVALEPRQADLLDRICAAPTIPTEGLTAAMAATSAAIAHRTASKGRNSRQGDLLG